MEHGSLLNATKEKAVMACILYDSLGESMRGGPFPHKAGEWCGNVLWRDVISLSDKSVRIVNQAALSNFSLPTNGKDAKFMAGKPAKEDNGPSSDDFIRRGYCGIYLMEDLILGEDEAEIEGTDIFCETVVSGECSPQKPVDFGKIRRREL